MSNRWGQSAYPKQKEFKYLRVLFTSEGKMEWEIDRRIRTAAAVKQALHRTFMVKGLYLPAGMGTPQSPPE